MSPVGIDISPSPSHHHFVVCTHSSEVTGFQNPCDGLDTSISARSRNVLYQLTTDSQCPRDAVAAPLVSRKSMTSRTACRTISAHADQQYLATAHSRCCSELDVGTRACHSLPDKVAHSWCVGGSPDPSI